jgi:putative Ca2+/H+ antiporter (TMEM165/GDT1 family)
MFASLVLASRGRPGAVWLGAACAFLVHVVIATTVGVALFNLLPHRVVSAIVAVMFLGGAVYAYREGDKDESELVEHEAATHRRVFTTAFLVIFIAEWGDLTQILTANLAAHYHSAVSVGVGAVAALWTVALIAVVGGQGLLRVVPITVVRRVTAVVLVVLAGVATWSAIGG